MSKSERPAVSTSIGIFVATILDGETQQTRRFVNDTDDINKLKDWLKTNECSRAVMESTSIYWVPLYLTLEESKFNVTLANAHQVKAIPGRKTQSSSLHLLSLKEVFKVV